MLTQTRRNVLIAASLSLPLVGCGGSESGSMTESIKLSGPLTLAAVSSDAPTIDGTIAISDTMASFPSGVLEDFASRYPAVSADEQFRRLSYSGGTLVEEVFGVEGESPDDSDSSDESDDSSDQSDGSDESNDAGIEISADYSSSGNFLSSLSVTENVSVPAAVSDALAILYPASTIDDAELQTDQNGTITYSVEIEQAEKDFEVTLDATGNVLQTTEEITASQVPSSVMSKFQQELTGISEVEYELNTDGINGTVTYEAEFEGQGESVSILCSDTGEIIAIEYEVHS